MRGHLRPRLGAEVLDDHLLDVAVALVQLADRIERLDSLATRLADPDQDSGREGDLEPAGRVDRLEAAGRHLVRRAEVGEPALGEALRRRLQHDPLRRRGRPQERQLLDRRDPRVRVREQAGLVEDEAAHGGEVLDRRLVAELGKLLTRHAVAKLGLVAEREERLVAAVCRSGARDVEHLVRPEKRALAAPGGPGEGAVVADVPAELCQRDEDLRRVGDDPGAPPGSRLGEQVVEGGFEKLGAAHTHASSCHNRRKSSGWSTSRASVGSSRTAGSRPAARARAKVSAAAPGTPKTGSNAVGSKSASAFRPPSDAGASATGRAAAASRSSASGVVSAQSAMTTSAPIFARGSESARAIAAA